MDLVSPDLKAVQIVRAERRHHGDVRRVTSIGDNDPSDSARIIARIKGAPFAAKINLDPRAEIHRSSRRDADVAEVAIHIAGRQIHTATKRYGQVREVAADTRA